AEPLQRADGVVFPAVEPAVDEALDAPPNWAEESGHDQRRSRDDERVLGTGDRAQPDGESRIHASQEQRESSVDERPVDDPIDVVEAELQDGQPNRSRHHEADSEVEPDGVAYPAPG